MTNGTLDDEGRDLLFRLARTHKAWLDGPVEKEKLVELYELLKWCPTSANTCPMRVLFLVTARAKERLRPALWPGNVEKTMAAPVTAIIAYDYNFAANLPRLFPHNSRALNTLDTRAAVESTARRNGTLQAAYLILAARAVGLDCGPMSGFDPEAVDREFFDSYQTCFPAGELKSDILCNLGYGNDAKLLPRSPRLGFEEACALL
jgi:3-hydroxypropanoate dehydrogenase